jgi:hypothetical protein
MDREPARMRRGGRSREVERWLRLTGLDLRVEEASEATSARSRRRVEGASEATSVRSAAASPVAAGGRCGLGKRMGSGCGERKKMRGREERREWEERVGVWGVRGARLWGEPGRVEERSSIRASLLSLAEGPFSGELGTAQVIRANLPNS